MGDPRKIRKKYETPVHPWQKARIVEEIKLIKEYGLKNKKEIWKFSSLLKKYKNQAKKLIAMQGDQADLERKQMMDKLKSLGLITTGNETFDAIFSLQLPNVLDRMLQTVLVKKGLARSTKQARQFIVHGHVKIGDKKITVPRYLVPVKDESSIGFSVSSSLFSIDHPERFDPTKQEVTQKENAPKIEVSKSEAPKTVVKEVKKVEKTKETTKKESESVVETKESDNKDNKDNNSSEKKKILKKNK